MGGCFGEKAQKTPPSLPHITGDPNKPIFYSQPARLIDESCPAW
jgi:hypothetical protein